ncbi:MAG: hypothetical protein Q7J43_01655 [Pseudomonas sp.]|uniref:hypothetical protein n=1 Tax=Pseudomonas sp. TaxID=306 RepID=UPI00271A658D|nr:hypothetical protein [Pseudomonas sp.]MDO9616367.1 hypothetical protein [Pseudomonas sp.]MDP2445737.1 hypothetical protein [Pseudomonas sp.]MDZ4332647.1 hypothetical protein [Pseudomonas sp.]
MDLLAEIKEKHSRLDESERVGLSAVIQHLEQAEQLLQLGREKPACFTDVIYRTNHVYEGCLKEAYRIITTKNPTNKNLIDIEKHLESNNLLRPRVVDLMKRYRTDWRNPSTHEHELFFSEQEAVLAIISVSAFATILIDQIIVHKNLPSSLDNKTLRIKTWTEEHPDYSNLPFQEKIISLIAAFSQSKKPDIKPAEVALTEDIYTEALAQFLRENDPSLFISTNCQIATHTGATINPDLMIALDSTLSTTITIEIKSSSVRGKLRDAAIKQALKYAAASNPKESILFFISDKPAKIKTQPHYINNNGEIITITEIFPDQNI